jgi:hypothetical protein
MPQLSSQSLSGPQRVERADRIADAVWEGHRGKIKRLYIDQGIRLEDLVKQMEEEHGFKARQVLLLVPTSITQIFILDLPSYSLRDG